jgi:hypothetical protein
MPLRSFQSTEFLASAEVSGVEKMEPSTSEPSPGWPVLELGGSRLACRAASGLGLLDAVVAERRETYGNNY